MRKFVPLALACVAFYAGSASRLELLAQTNHSGTCAGTFTAAGNPHRLTSTCTVPSGQTLTLGAGVIMEGLGNTLLVDGTLNADGATFNNAAVSYRVGSGGTIEDSTFSAATPISLSGTSVLSPAQPTIRNNTITGTSYGIYITGTSRPSVTGNTIETNNYGLYYSDTAAGTALNNTIRFLPEGANGRHGIYLTDSASPSVRDNTIQDDPTRSDIAIQVLVSPASSADIRNNSVCASIDDQPLVFGPGYFAATAAAVVAGNTFPCGPLTSVGVSGTFATDSQLDPVEGVNSFHLTTTTTAASGIRLTFPSGTRLDCRSHNLFVDGIFSANSVTFTNANLNYRDGSGGVIDRSTISGSIPIQVAGSSTVTPAQPSFKFNTIDGSTYGVYISGTGRPQISDNTITANIYGLHFADTSAGSAVNNVIQFVPEGGGGRRAVYLGDAASPSIRDNTIQNDPARNDIGIQILVNPASTAVVQNNRICATGGDQPLVFGPGYFAASCTASVTGTVFTCDALASVGISGKFATNSRLDPVEAVSRFRMTSTMFIDSGATLIMPTGIAIEGSGQTCFIDGVLSANGVTLDGVHLNYRDGSSGTLENSTLSGSIPIQTSGTSGVNPAHPTILNNTIEASNYGVYVTGTGRPEIRENDITTNSYGIYYADATAGEAFRNTIRFQPEGSSGRRALSLSDTASPRVKENTIADDPSRSDTAIEVVVNPPSTAQITFNEICTSGGDRPLHFGPGYFRDGATAVVADNVLTCDPLAAVSLSGILNADIELRGVEQVTVFRLGGTLTIGGGAEMKIPPGITIDGRNNTLSVDGTLTAASAEFLDVFLSFRAGSQGLVKGSELAGGAITIANSAPTLRQNIIRNMNIAIRLSGATAAVIEDNTFYQNTTGIYIQDHTSLSTVRVNSFRENENSLLFQDADALFSAYPAEFAQNSFLGLGSENTIQIPGALSVSGTIPFAPPAYRFVSSATIGANATVIIQPGCTFLLGSGVSITANGELVAVGTAEIPITFSGLNPKSGLRWGGLKIRNKQSALAVSALRHCLIEFAQDGVTLDNASIPIEGCLIADNGSEGINLINGSSPAISDCTIVQNLGHGIQAASSSNPVVQRSSIFGNGGKAIQNDTTATLRAENCFWGDDSGPPDDPADHRCDTLNNVNGLGDEVSDCVDFDPWKRVGPSLAGTLQAIGGNNQSGNPGTLLPQPLVVEVRSLLGSALAGVDVIFSVVKGDASIVGAMPVATNINGAASATVLLGSTPGEIAIAVTARDVNSPLASFLGETNAPCLMAAKILDPGLSGPCGARNLACAASAGGLELSWELSPEADCPREGIEVREDRTGVTAAVLPPDATSLQVSCPDLPADDGRICVVVRTAGGAEERICCEYTCQGRRGQTPGDLNQDLEVDIADAIGLLGHLFLGEPAALPCRGAVDSPSHRALLDWNGDARVDISDPIAQLHHLFLGGPPHNLGPAGRCVEIEGCPAACAP